jgi:formamidopyrimidine-DNA glycosylase
MNDLDKAFLELFKLKCADCGKTITADYYTVNGKHYCPQCEQKREDKARV